MLRLSLLASVFDLAALPVAAADAPLTADSIIAAQIKARGGAEALAAIKTLRFEGTLIFPGDFKLEVVEVKTRPGMVRTDATIQGLDVIQAYD